MTALILAALIATAAAMATLDPGVVATGYAQPGNAAAFIQDYAP